jgi:hypothetical protein
METLKYSLEILTLSEEKIDNRVHIQANMRVSSLVRKKTNTQCKINAPVLSRIKLKRIDSL